MYSFVQSDVFFDFRPQRQARLQILPQVQNFSEIDFPIIEDLVLTNEEALLLEEKNESLSDVPTQSPEMWLNKFYRKKIFPRKLNSEPTEPFRQVTTESSQTSDGTSETSFGKLSLQNATTTLNDHITTLDAEITETKKTTPSPNDDSVKDYEYIVFLNDKVKFKNFEYEEDYDTASLPDSDFNTINMLNDLFKITKPVGFAESQKLRFDEESPTTNTLEDENGLEATTYDTETESLPTNVAVEAENHDPEVKETTTTKTFTELAALIFEDPTTTSSTEFVEERESEILTISSFDLSTGTPMPEINTEENIVDTEASIEVKKISKKKSKLERLKKLKKKKGFRDQIEHFYQSKNPNFDFRVSDLAPFKNDFDFDFGDRSPVEDIRNKMSELLGKSNERKTQGLELFQRSGQTDFQQQQQQQQQQQVSFDGFENFGSNFQAFPSPQRPAVFSHFDDDFRGTENLFTPLSQRKRRIAFRVPESVKNDLIYHWINNN